MNDSRLVKITVQENMRNRVNFSMFTLLASLRVCDKGFSKCKICLFFIRIWQVIF